jgi:hypothetical protein
VTEAPLSHLEPLLDGTPLGFERMKLAWPALPISDRIRLLKRLDTPTHTDRSAFGRSYRREEMIDLALSDENAYIRYLAARHVDQPSTFPGIDQTHHDQDEKRYEKVKADGVDLVRFSGTDALWQQRVNYIGNPTAFWKLPHINRLVLVDGLRDDGDKISDLLFFATNELLPIQEISTEEMHDVLLQYLDCKPITGRFDLFDDGVSALWNAVPHLPFTLAYTLIESLPGSVSLGSAIAPEVLSSLKPRQIEQLLWRDDIALPELRRKVFEESSGGLRFAAMSGSDFELLDSDITERVNYASDAAEVAKRKIDELCWMAEGGCKGSTLVQFQATYDLAKSVPNELLPAIHQDYGLGDRDQVGFRQADRAKRLLARWWSPQLPNEVFHLRLYETSKFWADTKGGTDNLKKSLRDRIVVGDPWRTYLNVKTIANSYADWERTIGVPLARISHLGEFELPENLAETLDVESRGPFGATFDLAQDVERLMRNGATPNGAELEAMSTAFSRIAEVATRSATQMEDLSAQIKKLDIRTKQIGWSLVAVLILVLLTSH